MPKIAVGRKFRNNSSLGAKASLPAPRQANSLLTNEESSVAVVKSTPSTGSAKNAVLSSSSAVLSRGQKKRQMKREQYLRKESMILSSLRLKRQEEQSRRIDGLDALKDALMNVEATVTPTIQEDLPAQVSSQNRINTNHSRQVLLQKEVAHMNLVLQHPRFIEDPFSTIYEHLQNTFPAATATAAKAPPKQATKKRQRHKRQYRATRSKR